MKFLFYTHSLVSCWNHGNAHFLRGIIRELKRRGHEVRALEPRDGWSRRNLLDEVGEGIEARFAASFPGFDSEQYDEDCLHEEALDWADVVIVHEWTDPALVDRIGAARRNGGTFTLLFHDTHHRAVSSQADISGLNLEDYDGILAFGETLRERYLQAGWGANVFTWHEAADDALFHPLADVTPEEDLVWIGNWGDGERTAEITEYLIDPVQSTGLSATVYGVRYPPSAMAALKAAGIVYEGWIANAHVPEAFAARRMTVHIPRRPYVTHLPGIPTIRMFEALACGIPLVSAPWSDTEGLFRTNTDYLLARNGDEMQRHLRNLAADAEQRAELARNGLETIRQRHTCRHRIDELFAILASCGSEKVSSRASLREAAE